MKKLFHWVWSLLEVIVICYVILITSFILCKNKYGYTQIGDYTLTNVSLVDENNIQNSKKGDLLIIRNSNDIKVGDLIYYYAAYNEAYLINTDYVTGIESDDYTALYTITGGGEAITVAGSRVLGKYSSTYHKIGGILKVIESRIGFLFLVLLPIMIIFIYQVYEFIVIIRYERVEKDEEEESPSKPKMKKEVVSPSVENVEKKEQKKTEKFNIEGLNSKK